MCEGSVQVLHIQQICVQVLAHSVLKLKVFTDFLRIYRKTIQCLKLGHDSILPHPFQFLTQKSSGYLTLWCLMVLTEPQCMACKC